MYNPFAVYVENGHIDTLRLDYSVETIDEVENAFRAWFLCGYDIAVTYSINEKGIKNTPIRIHRLNIKRLWNIINDNTYKGKLVNDISYMFPAGTSFIRVKHWLEDTIGETWVEDLAEGRL